MMKITGLLGKFFLLLTLLGSYTVALASENGKDPAVLIQTNYGPITVVLDPQHAPITVKNFLAYLNSGFYADTVFHRVIPDFMIQGGGFTPSLNEKKTNAPIQIESSNGLKNTRGTIAMARTNVPNSATSQFYINVVDNDFLNYKNNSVQGIGYTVFGKVTDGMKTVDAIANVQTGVSHGMPDVPVKPVIIESISQLPQE